MANVIRFIDCMSLCCSYATSYQIAYYDHLTTSAQVWHEIQNSQPSSFILGLVY